MSNFKSNIHSNYHKLYSNYNIYNLSKSLNIQKCDNIYINKSYLTKEKENNIKKIISLEEKNLNDNENQNNNLNEQIKIKKNNKLIFMNKSLLRIKLK